MGRRSAYDAVIRTWSREVSVAECMVRWVAC
jgi:hypothetical protein